MDKEDVVIYTMEILLSHFFKKKSKIMPFAATWIEEIIISEGKSNRKTNTIRYCLYMESEI